MQCPCCQRTGGSPAGGTAINTIGCTGACLSWVLEVFENIMADCGSGYTEVDLVLFPDAMCEAVNLIFSELNVYGWALLNRGMCGNLCPNASIAVSFLEFLVRKTPTDVGLVLDYTLADPGDAKLITGEMGTARYSQSYVPCNNSFRTRHAGNDSDNEW